MTGKEFLEDQTTLITADQRLDEELSLSDLLDDAGCIGLEGAAEMYIALVDRQIKAEDARGKTNGG